MITVMTATAHALVGIAIAAKIHNPALALPIAACSHIALDLIPHWDPGTHWHEKSPQRFFTESLVDLLTSFVSSLIALELFFPGTNIFYGLLVAFAAQLPDWLMVPYVYFKIEQFKWAYLFGRKTNSKLDAPWGVVTQILAVLVIFWAAKLF